MRKMTKVAVTLAAMSAMTVASASMAFAAEKQVDGLNAVKTAEEVKAGSKVGTWDGNNKDGWTFTTDDGTKLKNTWGEIDGIWYWFDSKGIVAQDEIKIIDGNTYYFDENGIMATGWRKITSKMEAYSDLEFSPSIVDPSNYAYDEDSYAYVYQDYVWCYFDEHGVGKVNEWFQDTTGLWYYFDGNIMVRDVLNYQINPDNNDQANSSSNKIYGFDPNGAMLTGWNYGKNRYKTNNDPTVDKWGYRWYYYNKDGSMQKAGWKKIGSDWFLFANDDGGADVVDKKGTGAATADALERAYPVILNTYIASYDGVGDDEYFYVDEEGKMVTGIVTLPKKIYTADFYKNNNKIDVDLVAVETDKPEINFGTKGAATEGIVNNRAYVLDVNHTLAVISGNIKANSNKYSIAVTSNGTTFAISGGTPATNFYGRVVKNAFFVNDGELYLANEDGDLVAYLAVAIDQTNSAVDSTGTDEYIIFNRYGEALKGYTDKNKSAYAGNKTYWSTGKDVTINGVTVSVFSVNKSN